MHGSHEPPLILVRSIAIYSIQIVEQCLVGRAFLIMLPLGSSSGGGNAFKHLHKPCGRETRVWSPTVYWAGIVCMLYVPHWLGALET